LQISIHLNIDFNYARRRSFSNSTNVSISVPAFKTQLQIDAGTVVAPGE